MRAISHNTFSLITGGNSSSVTTPAAIPASPAKKEYLNHFSATQWCAIFGLTIKGFTDAIASKLATGESVNRIDFSRGAFMAGSAFIGTFTGYMLFQYADSYLTVDNNS